MLSSLDSKLLDSALSLTIEDSKIKVKVEDREVEFNAEKAKSAIELFKKYMPVKAVAISSDYLAGVIVYNEWFRQDGVRAVYITFEAEASKDDSAWRLIDNSVLWASKFEYKTQEMAKLIEKKKSSTKKEVSTVTKTTTKVPLSKTPGFEVLIGVVALLYALRKVKL